MVKCVSGSAVGKGVISGVATVCKMRTAGAGGILSGVSATDAR